MVTVLPSDSPTDRAWIGRDDNCGHYHGLVPLTQSPVRLVLSWKASDSGEAQPVGRFLIDLRELIRNGYARESDGAAFLRFQSAGERIEIAVNRAGPALVVGRNPLA